MTPDEFKALQAKIEERNATEKKLLADLFAKYDGGESEMQIARKRLADDSPELSFYRGALEVTIEGIAKVHYRNCSNITTCGVCAWLRTGLAHISARLERQS